MRKLSLTMCLLLATVFVYGQKKEVSNAYNFYQNGYLDRAKEAIDKAILNDETAKEAKTWMYRGNIYLRIADIQEREAQWQRDNADSIKKGRPAPILTKQMKEEREYLNLCSNCSEIAYESYMKARELDNDIEVSNMGIKTPTMGLQYCAGYAYNNAVELLLGKDKKYEEAYSLLVKANNANPRQEHIVYLLAYTAALTGKMDVAKMNYNDMIRNSHDHEPTKDIRVYDNLANIYKSEKDTVRVLNVMRAGEKVFMPEEEKEDTKNTKAPSKAKDTVYKETKKDTLYRDFVLVYSKYMSWAGKADDARDAVEEAHKKYPNNIIFIIAYGTILSEDEMYDQAEVYLKRALEMQPEEAIAVYNLGSCYFNHYLNISKKLGDIERQEEYEKQAAFAKELLEKARVEMEKAHTLDPKDMATLRSLKSIYVRMPSSPENKKRQEEIDEKINALK